ncbi:alpha/beta fold hydrolase [Maribellus comscasis]|uniref:Alpha/beta fold hydrolase n=1 Tax=Maribellus comscasis TaxID=2681766 RepID=A0A6I6JW13_9BACT|nr:alpha/beta fold hydrolase [Maribellus comscasis]QGY45489.1 alpha/beta fold hydrolase [Maribellus comscasis]
MDLFYRKEGKGAPLVIIHGLYGSSDNWLNIGKRLAERYTVYLIDQRNHGRSPFSDEHTFDSMKEDLNLFFEKHGIEKATLLGHSMGGKTAMWFAADYPEKIEKLVIADIAPKDYMQLKEDSQFYLHQNILLAMQDIDFNEIEIRNDVEERLAEKIDDQRIRQFLLKNVAKDKKTKRYKWRINVEVLYENLDEIVSGVNKSWLEDRIPITSYPVIFIRGMKSRYILPEDEKLIKEIYPEATIVDISDAGHWLHAEQPEKFMKAVMLCC